MKFYVFQPGQAPSIPGNPKGAWKNIVILKAIDWNDYGFYTIFMVTYYDNDAVEHDLYRVRIGFQGQAQEQNTFDIIPSSFESLDSKFFSIGLRSYYDLAGKVKEYEEILQSLNDIVLRPKLLDKYSEERVLNDSLLREVSATTVRDEYPRILRNLPLLTDFKFGFQCIGKRKESTFTLEFEVDKYSKPPSNIHAVIGKNGVGKTTLFNRMVDAALQTGTLGEGSFYDPDHKDLFGEQYSPLKAGYFSRVLSISFSAFDTFKHPEDNDQPAQGPCYSYLGLVDRMNSTLKSHHEIYSEFASSLAVIFSDPDASKDWYEVVDQLNGTNNFNVLAFAEFFDAYERSGGDEAYHRSKKSEFDNRFQLELQPLLESLSSGHFIVLRIIVELLRRVETKTLILIDEPETHLHPPLLSALVRIVSKILHNRNGVAITATHSPVVLQEIPKSCVWKIHRTGLAFATRRPKIETYGENVGVLTEEVFGLDVRQSGFVADLVQEVSLGKSFDEILGDYQGRLGEEGRVILMSLIATRDSQ